MKIDDSSSSPLVDLLSLHRLSCSLALVHLQDQFLPVSEDRLTLLLGD